MRLGLFTLSAILAIPFSAFAEDKASDCTDKTAVSWYFPGDFEAARKAAEQQNRILMIKGIAFGVDEAGAKCATKGCW